MDKWICEDFILSVEGFERKIVSEKVLRDDNR